MKRFVDLKTLSAKAGLSVFTLRKFAQKNMPHYKVGRKILVDPNEFDTWFTQHFKVVSPNSNDSFEQVISETFSELGI